MLLPSETGPPSYLEGGLLAFLAMNETRERGDDFTALELHIISDGQQDLEVYMDIAQKIYPSLTRLAWIAHASR